MDPAICVPKLLPGHLVVPAAANAVDINPVNAPAPALVAQPLRIAMATSKYWGPRAVKLAVRFMEKCPVDVRQKIMIHLNAWYSYGANFRFVYTTGYADVRITRDEEGYWSYLGTDVRMIPQTEPTMCLQGFTINTPDEEYRRVVRHEAGHTLGFEHEHMRKDLVALIDKAKAYRYFERTQGWDQDEVDQQVLTPLDDRSLMATPPDQTSVMCYQLPGSITRNGRPIIGGLDINATDSNFASKVYPKR